MKRRTNKKGFTIVELVIVIAVIAILAAVLIPTFASLVKKANATKDVQLVRNLNTALAADNKEHDTMTSALEAAAAFGYDIAKINASATDNEILWDSKNDSFCYLNDGEIQYIPEANNLKETDPVDFWVISDEVSKKYSTYLYGCSESEVTAEAGLNLEVGNGNTENLTVKYESAGSVTIRTNGGNLEINNAAANVYHYGSADNVLIKQVATSSYHLRATVTTLEVWHGNIVPEQGSVQVLVVTKDDGDTGSNAPVTFKPIENSSAVINNVVINTEANLGDSEEVIEAIKEALSAAVTEGGKCTEVENADEIESAVAQATAFESGTGTEANPYIIANVEQLKNIALNYETGYAYYKVADGVEVLDCSNWPNNIKLNGSFDGNGVKIINLDYALFNTVGTVTYDEEGKNGVNNVENIVIENLDATINVTNGSALVRNLINGGVTTFKNVHIHGYIESNMNTGSFYKYGTANAANCDGSDYTVNFINSTSDATIVDTLNQPGTMIGHTYAGTGHTVTINMDENSGFKGAVFSTSGKADELIAIAGTCILNGEAYTSKVIEVNKITVIKPVEAEDGYTVELASGVSCLTVTIGAQVTSYDENGVKIPNATGISINLVTTNIEEIAADAANVKVFDGVVTGMEIVNDYKDGSYGYELTEEGVLKVYVGDRGALTGWSTLQVSQYSANGNLLATGTYTLYTISELK